MSVFLNGLSDRRPVGHIATTPPLRDNRRAIESYAVLITGSLHCYSCYSSVSRRYISRNTRRITLLEAVLGKASTANT